MVIQAGWYIITGSYFIVLLISSWTYTVITDLPIDHHRNLSGLAIGTVMVLIPYIIGGLYARKFEGRTKGKAAFWMSLVPAVCEKLFIFLIGALFVASGGDGGGDGIVNWSNVMQFVGAEALPYFTNLYLLTIPVSVLICVVTAKLTPSRTT